MFWFGVLAGLLLGAVWCFFAMFVTVRNARTRKCHVCGRLPLSLPEKTEVENAKALVRRVVQKSPDQKNWYSLYCDSEAAMMLRRWVS